MASKAPPIPPAQRASPGDKPHIQGGSDPGSRRGRDQQARSASVNQNTHHGHQQDR